MPGVVAACRKLANNFMKRVWNCCWTCGNGPRSLSMLAGQPVLQTESMAEWLRCPQVQVRTALEKLAYDVHRQQETATGTADIAEGALVVALMHAARDPDLKQERVIQ